MKQQVITTIFIRDLKLKCFVGIYPEEKIKKQNILVHLKLEGDFSKAARDENIRFTVDYSKLVQDIKIFVEKSKFSLIENLAYQVGKHIIAEFTPVETCTIEVVKLNALKNAIPSIEMKLFRNSSTNV